MCVGGIFIRYRQDVCQVLQNDAQLMHKQLFPCAVEFLFLTGLYLENQLMITSFPSVLETKDQRASERLLSFETYPSNRQHSAATQAEQNAIPKPNSDF